MEGSNSNQEDPVDYFTRNFLKQLSTANETSWSEVKDQLNTMSKRKIKRILPYLPDDVIVKYLRQSNCDYFGGTTAQGFYGRKINDNQFVMIRNITDLKLLERIFKNVCHLELLKSVFRRLPFDLQFRLLRENGSSTQSFNRCIRAHYPDLYQDWVGGWVVDIDEPEHMIAAIRDIYIPDIYLHAYFQSMLEKLGQIKLREMYKKESDIHVTYELVEVIDFTDEEYLQMMQDEDVYCTEGISHILWEKFLEWERDDNDYYRSAIKYAYDFVGVLNSQFDLDADLCWEIIDEQIYPLYNTALKALLRQSEDAEDLLLLRLDNEQSMNKSFMLIIQSLLEEERGLESIFSYLHSLDHSHLQLMIDTRAIHGISKFYPNLMEDYLKDIGSLPRDKEYILYLKTHRNRFPSTQLKIYESLLQIDEYKESNARITSHIALELDMSYLISGEEDEINQIIRTKADSKEKLLAFARISGTNSKIRRIVVEENQENQEPQIFPEYVCKLL